MKAILSGQAGTAVCIENDGFFSVTLDSEEPLWVSRNKYDIPYLFFDYNDIFEDEFKSRSEVIEKLEIAWGQDRGLQLTLIALDNKEYKDIRIEAIECLNNLFDKPEVREYVENRLYSAPMPYNADLKGAISLSEENCLETARKFFSGILNDQDEISKRCDAWNNLPDDIFSETVGNKKDFYLEVVRYGAFRLFAKERDNKDSALYQLLIHPHFRGTSAARTIFGQWAAPFKSSSKIEFGEQESNKDYNNNAVHDFKKYIYPQDAREQAEKQKNAIKNLILKGNFDKAITYTNELIENQRKISEPKHIAMSLCDLAQFSKKIIGNPELQAKFAELAIKEDSDDSWSYSTLGDAYRLLAKYEDARKMYETAICKSDNNIESKIVAFNGHAEIFKNLGQLEEAIKFYKQCIDDYGNDMVSKTAYATGLAHYGRFEEALAMYNEVIQEHPIEENLISRFGRATVLNEIGKKDEALEEIQSISYKKNNDILKRIAYFLRDYGKLEEAEKISSNLIRQDSDQDYSIYEIKALHAKILGDLGKFDNAIKENENNINDSPLSPWSYSCNAEIYKKMGDMKKALEAYDLFISKFPNNGFCRNGRASVLVALGRYQEAIEMLNEKEKPASKSEWVAYHIKGMAFLRRGELTEAEKIFEWGLRECSWISQREYFKTALASLRIRQEKYHEAISLVEEINNPFVKSVANVIVLHASGELGNKDLFMKSYEAFSDTNSSDKIIELRDVMKKKYIEKNNIYTNEEIYLKECDILIAAA